MRPRLAKGFTLVEIMVVIVIMGILAAVAVPKLFGAVAKAKSSELTVASGIYMRLQDAAVMGHGTVGNWKTIGYDAPGTGEVSKYFKYNQGNLTESSTKIEDLGDGMIGWEASNVVNLNECKAGSLWNITITAGEGGHVAYNAQVSSDACISVASAFTQGNIASVGNTENAGSAYVPPEGKTHLIGQNILADANMSRVNGRFHPQYGYQESPSNEYTAWKIVNSNDVTEGTWKGTVELEPNTEYQLTISVPENVWNMDKGQYLQTEVNVFTEDPQTGKWPAISLATRSEAEKPDQDPNIVGTVKEKKADGTDKYPNGNGYNTGSGRAQGYEAQSSIKTENGMVTTTITIKTGADGGHMSTSLFSYGEGWTNGRYTAADEAIKNATLVKIADTEKK